MILGLRRGSFRNVVEKLLARLFAFHISSKSCDFSRNCIGTISTYRLWVTTGGLNSYIHRDIYSDRQATVVHCCGLDCLCFGGVIGEFLSCLAERVSLLLKHDFQFPIQTVHVAPFVLGQLIPLHGKCPHLSINVLLEIRHPLVAVFCETCDEFRGFLIAHGLAVVFHLFDLVEGMRIDLDNTDTL